MKVKQFKRDITTIWLQMAAMRKLMRLKSNCSTSHRPFSVIRTVIVWVLLWKTYQHLSVYWFVSRFTCKCYKAVTSPRLISTWRVSLTYNSLASRYYPRCLSLIPLCAADHPQNWVDTTVIGYQPRQVGVVRCGTSRTHLSRIFHQARYLRSFFGGHRPNTITERQPLRKSMKSYPGCSTGTYIAQETTFSFFSKHEGLS